MNWSLYSFFLLMVVCVVYVCLLKYQYIQRPRPEWLEENTYDKNCELSWIDARNDCNGFRVTVFLVCRLLFLFSRKLTAPQLPWFIGFVPIYTDSSSAPKTVTTTEFQEIVPRVSRAPGDTNSARSQTRTVVTLAAKKIYFADDIS